MDQCVWYRCILVLKKYSLVAALQESVGAQRRERRLSDVVQAQIDAENWKVRDNWQLVVLLCTDAVSKAAGAPEPCWPCDSAGEWDTESASKTQLIPIPVPLNLVTAIGTDRLELPSDLRSESALQAVLKSLGAYIKRYV